MVFMRFRLCGCRADIFTNRYIIEKNLPRSVKRLSRQRMICSTFNTIGIGRSVIPPRTSVWHGTGLLLSSVCFIFCIDFEYWFNSFFAIQTQLHRAPHNPPFHWIYFTSHLMQYCISINSLDHKPIFMISNKISRLIKCFVRHREMVNMTVLAFRIKYRGKEMPSECIICAKFHFIFPSFNCWEIVRID